MSITWDPSFESGIDIIDAQHREILELAGELCRSVTASCSPASLRLPVARMLELTATHYATEEQYMGAFGYPLAGPHTEAHARSFAEICAFADRVAEGHPSLGAFVYTFFQGWLKHHISTFDLDLIRFLRAER